MDDGKIDFGKRNIVQVISECAVSYQSNDFDDISIAEPCLAHGADLIVADFSTSQSHGCCKMDSGVSFSIIGFTLTV